MLNVLLLFNFCLISSSSSLRISILPVNVNLLFNLLYKDGVKYKATPAEIVKLFCPIQMGYLADILLLSFVTTK